MNFLDTTIILEGDVARFRVFRKPTNKENYIHYYSAHNMRTKSGIIIGFFLRALRICSEEYLQAEINHIFEVFTSLKYPKAMIIKCKNKANQIRKKKEAERGKQEKKQRRCERIIVVPYFEGFEEVSRGLELGGIKLIAKSGTKIGDLVRRKQKTENENSLVYRVPCGGCHKSYIGESYRGLKTRLSEHKRDLKNHKLTNSMVIHAESEDHLPSWDNAKPVKTGMTKRHRKILESALIESVPCTNHRGGFYTRVSRQTQILANL